MTTPRPCEVREEIAQSGATLLVAYSPAKFDRRLVSTLKSLRGVSCRRNAHGFCWRIRADHICADDFRAAFAAAAERQGGAQITAANLAYHMYDKDGALYG